MKSSPTTLSGEVSVPTLELFSCSLTVNYDWVGATWKLNYRLYHVHFKTDWNRFVLRDQNACTALVGVVFIIKNSAPELVLWIWYSFNKNANYPCRFITRAAAHARKRFQLQSKVSLISIIYHKILVIIFFFASLFSVLSIQDVRLILKDRSCTHRCAL